MKIFDNIGCEFIYNNENKSFILLGPLPGYAALGLEDIGVSIPYLARNINGKNIEYELGIGYLDKNNNSLILRDKKVLSSSNNGQAVDFNKIGLKHFYVFVNNVNFNNAFNNIFLKNQNFLIEPKKSTYIVDTSFTSYVIGSLPDAKECEAVEIEFKTIGDKGSLSIRDNNKFELFLNTDSYAKIVSTGTEWMSITKSSAQSRGDLKILSSDNQTLSILSEPTGSNRSLQYNNNGSFGSSSIYEGSSGKLLFGSDTETSAKHIIPSDGNDSLIFNATRDGSDFIVYGTGNAPGYPEKNLYFSYDGKLGINMPSGVNTGGIIRPSTILHVFNTLCKEGIRLENRANCYPADITLYDNPVSYPRADGSGIARIVFAGKDALSNRVNFGTIETKIKSASNKLGQIDLSVHDGTRSRTTISSSASATTISTNNASINLDDNTINASGQNINLNGTSSVSISGPTIISNGLRLPYVNQSNVLLSVDSNKQIVAATGFQIPGINTSGENFLTTTPDGTIVAEWSKYSFWPYESGQKIGGKDVIWDRYPYRSGDVCSNKSTRELQIEPTPTEEFDINDQIAIVNLNNNSTIYRFISDIVIDNDTITGFVLDQPILITDNNPNVRVYSVTKGGVLTNTVFTEGVIADTTAIVLSTRKNNSTIFNTAKKDIDFTIYGIEDIPTFNIHARTESGGPKPGQYFKYATQTKASDGIDVPPFTVLLSEVGAGSSNSSANNSANVANTNSQWFAKLSSVGLNGKSSFYGTYDQNGNAYEWIEDEIKTSSYSANQYVCGGSWRTSDNNAIRGYIKTPRYSGLDDVGFRICSKAGFSNTIVENLLSLSFTRVDDINNSADTQPLYTEDWTNRFQDTNDQPMPLTKINLGVVNYPYRINKYEITNQQYAVFLNSLATGTATINNLYKSSMTASYAGGIIQSGSGTTNAPFSYHVKANMANKPVVFVDYVSSIRFINWLSNGAPTGTSIPDGVTEYGAYTIEAGPGGADLITKNRDQNYWLPSLNEWHKAAYYSSKNIASTEIGESAVTIRRINPFEYASAQPFQSGSGLVASLSVSGLTYTDYLKIGDQSVQDIDRAYQPSLGFDSAVLANSGISYIVNQNTTTNEVGKAIFRSDRTILCQPLFVTTGVASTVNSTAGFLITSSGFTFVDPANPNDPVNGLFPGPDGGYIFKNPDGSDRVSSSGKLIAILSENDYYPSLTNTNANEIIHNNSTSLLSSSSWFTVGDSRSELDVDTTDIVNIHSKESGASLPVLCTDRILVGPPLPGYEGSLLTHNGNKPAYWQANDFLKAPGATWNRFSRRAVELVPSDDTSSIKLLKFVDLDISKGGTGPITLEDIEREFNFNETIAIYNQAREVTYVKVANIGVVDSRNNDIDSSFFLDQDTLTIAVCPGINSVFASNSRLELAEDDPDNGRLIAYAFSAQKGTYFRMGIEPPATGQFACAEEDTSTSEYRFKPGSFNTISTRPEVHTVFNSMADDIDFVIYGYRKTLFTRYEPDWFNQDSGGIPTGLNPALRVHAKIGNSYVGSIESGVHKITVGNNGVATGVLPDLKSKITINTNNPYTISSLTGINYGVILPASSPELNLELEKMYGSVIPATGLLVSGDSPISNYADLTVNGSTYTDTLIAKDVILAPLWTGEVPIPYELSTQQKIYAPNYPLTINNLGQVVSMVPPPSPKVPSKPLNLQATAKNAAASLSWQTPENNGGVDILGYIVEYSVTNGTTWVVYDQLNSTTLLPVIADRNTVRYLEDNIINNTSYIFRVRAYNSIGLGPYSEASSPVTPSTSLSPSAPQNVRITAGEDIYKIRNSANITLSWNPVSSIPAGTELIEYKIEYWVYGSLNNTDIKNAVWTDAGTVNGSINTINLTGIDLKPLYYFSVVAKTSNNTISSRAIYASLGSDPDPRPVTSVPPPGTENPYNFGTMVFLGSCQE